MLVHLHSVNLIHKSCGLETRPQVIPCFPLYKHGKNLQNILNIVIMKTDGVYKKLQGNDELLIINDQMITHLGQKIHLDINSVLHTSIPTLLNLINGAFQEQ